MEAIEEDELKKNDCFVVSVFSVTPSIHPQTEEILKK